MPPTAGGEGMNGNRIPVPPHRPLRTLENTATHNTTLVPGATTLRHSGPASRPSPLRGSTSGRALTPTPRWRLSAPSREPSRNRSQPVQPDG